MKHPVSQSILSIRAVLRRPTEDTPETGQVLVASSRRRQYIIAALGMLPLLGSPSYGQAKKSGVGDILLGQTIDLSGPERGLGNELVLGINMYFKHLNAKGGINGRKIRLEILDDGYDVERASGNVQKLLADPALLAFLTPLGTTTTLRVAKGAGDVPVLFPLTGTAGIRGEATPNTYFLRATYGDEVQRIWTTASRSA